MMKQKKLKHKNKKTYQKTVEQRLIKFKAWNPQDYKCDSDFCKVCAYKPVMYTFELLSWKY